jgi:hypothetical protein
MSRPNTLDHVATIAHSGGNINDITKAMEW